MKKLNKKFGIVSVGVIILTVAGILLANNKKPADDIGTTVLNKGELVSSINISGTVKSAEEHKIYSKESLAVKEVRVEVGDYVRKGDILAVLDADSITKELEKANVTMASNVKTKEDQALSIQFDLVATEKKVRASELALEKQKLSYDNTYNEYKLGTNAELSNAKMTLDRAEIEKHSAHKDYENNKQLFEQGFVSKSEYEASEDAYKKADINYNNAVKAYNLARDGFEKAFKQAKIDLEIAQNSYEVDVESLNSAKHKNTANHTYTIEQQKVEIERLKNRIDDCMIKAPADGTITAVNVKEGQTPNAIVFELEDTEELIITTYIKEYDVVKVKEGQKVIIKSDGTGDKAISGTVVSIAPTTRKDSTSKNSEFETKVKVTEVSSGLKIGMEARMNIILNQKENVFYTAYDSVLKQDSGQEVIYINDKGKVKEIPVKIGVESDVYVEIQGDGLAEGMQVITNPGQYKPDEKIK